MIALNRALLTAITSDAEVVEQTQLLAAGYIVRGRRFLELDMITESVSDLTTAIKLDPTNAEAFEYRARAHHELADVRNRGIDLRRADELRKPDYEGEPRSWSFTAGYELAVQRTDGSEQTLRTYPLTNDDRDDALMDAALLFSRQESRNKSPNRERLTPVIYEMISVCREISLDSVDN